MRGRVGVILVHSLLLASVGLTQSLGELAQKEKERRQKLKEHAKVIDDEALKQGRRDEPATEGESNQGEPVPASPQGRTVTPRTAQGESLDAVKNRRGQCDQAYRKAQEEKNHQQALFDAGMASVAMIEGEEYQGNRIVRSKTPVSGERISCREALAKTSEYPTEASQCYQIRQRIETADAEMKRASDCMRQR